MKVFLYTTIFSNMSIILPFLLHFHKYIIFLDIFRLLISPAMQRIFTSPPQSRPSHHPPHPHNHCRCHIGHNRNHRPCRYRHIRHHTNHRCVFRSCSSLCCCYNYDSYFPNYPSKNFRNTYYDRQNFCMRSICRQMIYEDNNSCCHLPVCYHILSLCTLVRWLPRWCRSHKGHQ